MAIRETISVQASKTASCQNTAGEDLRFSLDLNNLAVGGSIVLVASAFGNGLNYLFAITLARFLGVSEFGVYALGLTLFNILSLVAPLGMSTGSLKFVSQQLGLRQDARARSTILAALIIAASSSILFCVSLILSSDLISSHIYRKPELAPVLVLFAAAVPLASLSTVLTSILQAFQTVKYTVLIKYVWEPIGKFAIVGALLAVGFGLRDVLAGILLTLAISVAIGLMAVWRIAGFGLKELGEWHYHDIRSLLLFCLPLTLSSVFGVIAPRSDMLILGYWTEPQEMGIYLAALQTSAIIALVLGSFETAFAPLIARVLALHDTVGLNRVYQSTSRLVFLCATPMFVLIVTLSRELLILFGLQFSTGVTCLIILATGHVINSAASSPNHVLLMDGKSRLVMANTILVGILQMAVTAVLVPLWGMIGAALATAGGLVVITAIRVLQVWRLYGVQPFTWSMMKPLVSGMITAAVILAIKGWIAGMLFPVLVFLSILIYLGTLSLLGLDPADRLILYGMASKLGLQKFIAPLLKLPKNC
jgi:O-antigen/teichoic acid export membrane protein